MRENRFHRALGIKTSLLPYYRTPRCSSSPPASRHITQTQTLRLDERLPHDDGPLAVARPNEPSEKPGKPKSRRNPGESAITA
jgi:hypothetical protein